MQSMVPRLIVLAVLGLILLGFVLFIYILIRNSRRKREDSPDYQRNIRDYKATKADFWHWGSPPKGLEKRDFPQQSSLALPRYVSFGETWMCLAGYFFLTGTLYVIGALIAKGNATWEWLFTLFLLYFSWIFMQADKRLIRIERDADTITLVLKYGFFIPQRRRFQRSYNLDFQGKALPGRQVSRYEQRFHYRLAAYRQNTLRTSYRCTLSCGEKEGDWIVKELNRWVHPMGKKE